eukprot:279572_1
MAASCSECSLHMINHKDDTSTRTPDSLPYLTDSSAVTNAKPIGIYQGYISEQICNLCDCCHLNRFYHLMKDQNNYSMENIRTSTVRALDSYLHLIEVHNNDLEFEFICNKLGDCNINDCSLFIRNYRDRQ